MKKEFCAERLKSARLAAGLSLEELSVLCGRIVSRQSLSNYETGRMSPRESSLDKVGSKPRILQEQRFHNRYAGTSLNLEQTPVFRRRKETSKHPHLPCRKIHQLREASSDNNRISQSTARLFGRQSTASRTSRLVSERTLAAWQRSNNKCLSSV